MTFVISRLSTIVDFAHRNYMKNNFSTSTFSRSIEMNWIFSIVLIFVYFSPLIVRCDDDNSDDDDKNESLNSTSSELPSDSDLMLFVPDNIVIVEVDAVDYIKENNEKHHMMGVADEKCDNASVNFIKLC